MNQETYTLEIGPRKFTFVHKPSYEKWKENFDKVPNTCIFYANVEQKYLERAKRAREYNPEKAEEYWNKAEEYCDRLEHLLTHGPSEFELKANNIRQE